MIRFVHDISTTHQWMHMADGIDRAFAEGTQLRIDHRFQDGYISAANGQEMKEMVSLREFMSRFLGSIRSEELRQIEWKIGSAIRSRDEQQQMALAKTLDKMYSNGIREGTIRLPAHNQHTDIYAQHMLSAGYQPGFRNPTGRDEADKAEKELAEIEAIEEDYKETIQGDISDDDVYYLMTL